MSHDRTTDISSGWSLLSWTGSSTSDNVIHTTISTRPALARISVTGSGVLKHSFVSQISDTTIMNTNPIAKSFRTGEFWSQAGFGLVIVLITQSVFGITDHAVSDQLVKLLASALTGVSAIVTLGLIAINMYNKRTDLKTAMIAQGLIPDEEPTPVIVPPSLPTEETLPVETPPVEAPLSPEVAPDAPVAG